jgi:pyruvate dehydrogenase kinase 2/3/4
VVKGGARDPPPIEVVLATSSGSRNQLLSSSSTNEEDMDDDFSIKVSDQGYGMCRRSMSRIWTYLHTTADRKTQEALLRGGSQEIGASAPMAGFGYGLPLSRLHARHFGGDLQLVSMRGYGTDAYLFLSKLGDNALNLE